MSERTIVVTEANGSYKLESSGISKFEMIGILECLLFDAKTAARAEAVEQQKEPAAENKAAAENGAKETAPEAKKNAPPEPGVNELRTRISNAVKAIRGLGGKVEDADLNELSEDELQTELSELTEQYKRLKSSKGAK